MPVFAWLFNGIVLLLRWIAGAIITNIGKLMTSFWAGLLFYLPAVIPKILAALGVGTVTYVLGGFGLDVIYNAVEARLSGLPADMLTYLKMTGFPEALSILFGALSARLTYSALGATKKSFTWNA